MESDGTLLAILTVATPFLLLVLGGVGWLYRHERERRAAAEQQVSERKYQAYLALLNIFFDQFKAIRHKKQLPMGQLVDRMVDANKELMLYASDDVLSLYQDWLEQSRRGVVDMEQFGQLIVEIRRDMGHPKTGISSDDVLRQVITDYDQVKAQGGLQRRMSQN
jgi:predicted DNA-binding ribbon-helix-helix protein